MGKFLRNNTDKYYILLLVGGILYALLTVTGPVTGKTYGLSLLSYRLLLLTLVIPLLLIWGAAFYGAVKFKQYSLSIIKSKDGKALNQLSNGLLVLAVGLLLSNVVGSLRQRFIDAGHLIGFTQVIGFIEILVPLIAFYIMLRGARRLVLLVNTYRDSYTSFLAAMIAVATTASLFVFGLMNNPYRNMTPDPQKYSSYYLSDWALMLGIVLPNILVWTFGLATVLSLNWYARTVKGTIYRAAIKLLLRGLTWVVFLSIGLNLLTTTSRVFANLSLQAILSILYVIIVIYAGGFILIALGAKKLSELETIK